MLNAIEKPATAVLTHLPTLTSQQQGGIYQAFNGYTESYNLEREAKLLPWRISEAYKHDSKVKELLGNEDEAMKFIGSIVYWSTTQRIAVILDAKAYITEQEKITQPLN